MSWTNGLSELRTILSDGAADKLRHRKAVLGVTNGTNKRFKTLEFRRLTTFVSASVPYGAYVNGVLAAVTADDLASGEFALNTAPAAGDTVEATYYIQWFTDAELTVFLNSASQWLGLGDSFSVVDSGLRSAASKYATADAYQKLALRWTEFLSETYRAEDAQADVVKAAIDSYAKLAEMFRKEAYKSRDQFYSRQGQALAPRFLSVAGNVSDPVPKR